jgi:hypothetical protein
MAASICWCHSFIITNDSFDKNITIIPNVKDDKDKVENRQKQIHPWGRDLKQANNFVSPAALRGLQR